MMASAAGSGLSSTLHIVDVSETVDDESRCRCRGSFVYSVVKFGMVRDASEKAMT